MATFITTIRFTQQGMANIQDTCRRATAVKAAARKLGVKITKGNVHTQTSRAFTMAEMEKILAATAK